MTAGKRMGARVDIYQDVTDRIAAELEAGPEQWVKTWTSATGDLWCPTNHATERPYRGINIVVLALTGMSRGFRAGRWLTFKQAKDLGGRVRKGEKGTRVVLWKFSPKYSAQELANGVERNGLNIDPQREGDGKVLARWFTVFNVEQCDGLQVDETGTPGDVAPSGLAQDIIDRSGATIVPGEPSFVPALNVVRMPPPGAFDDVDEYVCTLLHELVHHAASRAMPRLAG